MIERILLPVDDSPHSTTSAEYAAQLSRTVNADIVVLHCQPVIPPQVGEPNFQHLIDLHRKQAEEIMAPVRDALKWSGAPFQERVVEGRPGEMIPEVAAAEKCDLIVMGSKGKTDFEGLMLGSVTHRVLHVAPCPVLVVRS